MQFVNGGMGKGVGIVTNAIIIMYAHLDDHRLANIPSNMKSINYLTQRSAYVAAWRRLWIRDCYPHVGTSPKRLPSPEPKRYFGDPPTEVDGTCRKPL